MAEEESKDIFYVCQKKLEELRQILKDGKEVVQEHVRSLADPEGLADDELVVPVDMAAAGDFGDVDEMVEKLGPKGAVEAFIKARDFLVNAEKDKPEDDRTEAMSAQEWREVLMDDEGGMSGLGDEGEEGEEELLSEEEEDDEGDAVEPPDKKAKTD